MAEEEVLQEAPTKPKKEKEGGIKLIHLVLIGFILIIVSVAATFFLQGKMGQFFGSMGEEMTKLRVSQLIEQAEREGKANLVECADMKRFDVKSLTEDPIIVNMADGEHFISTTIAVCIEKKKVTEEEFQTRVPQMLHIINDSLSRVSKADLFEGAEAPEEEQALELELGDLAAETGEDFFAKNLDNLRLELLGDLLRNFPYVKDVYFEQFLVQ